MFRRLLKLFLIDILKVSPDTAEQDACRMEHVISQESFERLRDAYKTKNE